MNTDFHRQLLQTLMTEFRHQPFSVCELRDVFLSRTHLPISESARARRWIAGQCKTYERRGWLHIQRDPLMDRSYYSVNIEHWPIKKIEQSDRDPVVAESETKCLTDLEQLSGELETYRRKVITQLSEIEEYQRIQKAYPSLKKMANDRFNRVVEENYRLLGKVRALENLVQRSQETHRS